MLSAFFVFPLSLAAAAEIPVSAPVPIPALGPQYNPQIASDGTGFLVVWQDARELNGRTSIWAMRVGADGQPLDPTGTRVSPPGEFGVRNPAVVWTGETYLVGWTNANSSVETLRVGRDGRVLDAAPQRVVNGVLAAGAALGGNALFATVRSNSIDVWAVDAAGAFVNVDSVNRGLAETNPQLAANGSAALLAWRHWDGTRPWVAIAPVSSHGNVATPRLIAAQFPLAVVAADSGFLVIYQDDGGALIAERVDDRGATLARNVLPFTSKLVPLGLAAGRFGDGYVVLLPGRTPAGMRLDANGAYSGAFPIPDTVIAFPTLAAFATNGTATLMAWNDLRAGSSDIFAQLLGGTADPALLSRAAPEQRSVVAAPNVDGSSFLAAWLETRSETGSRQLRFRRFTRDGVPLDPDSLFLTDAVAGSIAIAFDGVDWIVAWITPSPSRVAYARIALDGRVLDPTPRILDFAVSPNGLALSSSGSETLVVFAPLTPGLYGTLIRLDGTTAGFPERISWDGEVDARPAVAWSGSQWLVAWERATPFFVFPPIPGPPPPATHDVHAARVTPSLQVLDPVPIVVAGSPAEDSHPSVASDGRDFVAAWQGIGGNPVGTLILARAVAANGTLGDVVTLGPGTAPSVTWRFGAYVSGWIQDTDLVTAPLDASQPVTRLATGADPLSTILLNGPITAYDRVDPDPRSGTVPRGFVQPSSVTFRHRIWSAAAMPPL